MKTSSFPVPNISATCYFVYCFLRIAQVSKCRMRKVSNSGVTMPVVRDILWVVCEGFCWMHISFFFFASNLLFSANILFKQYLIVAGDLIADYKTKLRKSKVKLSPYQVVEAYRIEMLRIAHCLDNRLTDCGKFVSLTHRPRFTPQKHFFYSSGTHFC
jgi:hypothetical protein